MFLKCTKDVLLRFFISTPEQYYYTVYSNIYIYIRIIKDKIHFQ